MSPMSGDVAIAHLFLAIPLATGIAQVSSAMTRWPRRFPENAGRRFELARALLPKAMKALAGSSLVDLSIAGVFALQVPLATLPMLASAVLMFAAIIELPSEPGGSWPGVTLRRVPAFVAWARRATFVAVLVVVEQVVVGALPWSAFLVCAPLLFIAIVLRRWSGGAAAELARHRSPETSA
jgi:hypothetical protein